MNKRFTSFLAALLCMAGTSVWATDYTIGTPAELTAFAATVNAGEGSANATLTADINMDGVDWTPIGDLMPYTGTFDGAGHKILNLTMTQASANGYCGFFGKASNGAVIKNLTLDATCSFSSTVNYTAALVADGSTAIDGTAGITIVNCVNQASATTTGTYSGGFMSHTSIPVHFLNSVYEGTVTAYKQAGGFIGQPEGVIEITFADCTNRGSINTTYETNMTDLGSGGFVGFHNNGVITLSFEGCVNEGEVYCSGSRAGGFCARVGVAGSTVNFTECVNRGKVTTNYHMPGGFIGFVMANVTMTDCCNAGEVTSILGKAGTGGETNAGGYFSMLGTNSVLNATRCVNMGTVDPATDRAAGFVSYNQASTVTLTDCYNIGTIKDSKNKGYAFTSGGTQSPKTTLVNCWNGGVTGLTTGNTLNSMQTSVTNSYDLVNTTSTYGVAAKIEAYDETWPTSGAFTYHINTEAQRIVYYQTLGTDTLPTLDNTHGTVYQVGRLKCDGVSPEEDGAVNYSNNAEERVVAPHTFVNGVCTVCGNIEEGYVPQVDDVFQIGTPEQLIWFAAYVNKVSTKAKGCLTADIDLSDVENFTPIGLFGDNSPVKKNFGGTFDGNKHVISNLTVSTDELYEAGLFSRLNGATVKNLGILNATVSTNNKAGRTGALAGFAMSCTITNCWIAGSISLTCTDESVTRPYIGALAGGTSSNTLKATNCWSTYEGKFVDGSPTYTNCHYYEKNNNIADDAASGALCYALNKNTFVNAEWFQTLGEDDLPTQNPERGIIYKSGDDFVSLIPTDENSFNTFLEEIIAVEKSEMGEKTAYKALLDEYEANVEAWAQAANFEQFCTLYQQAQEMKVAIAASEKAYEAYVAACEEAEKYLEENDFKSKERTILDDYLHEVFEPGEDYPNGSFLYILDTHLLSDEEIAAEVEYLNVLRLNAFNSNIIPGTDLTVKLANGNFADGLKGWDVTSDVANAVTTGGNKSIMPIARGLNSAFSVSQTLEGLPNGIYELSINGFSRTNGDPLAKLYTGEVFLNGNANHVMAISEDAISVDEAVDSVNCLLTGDNVDAEVYNEETLSTYYVPTSLAGCSFAFNAGRYKNRVAVEVTDSTLTLGVRDKASALGNWLPFAGMNLVYLGSADEANESLSAVLDDYMARATTIFNTEGDNGSDYEISPCMYVGLHDQLGALMEQKETAATGAQKMELINSFSEIFGKIYSCRMTYIALVKAIEKVEDMATNLYTDSMLDKDVYEEKLLTTGEAWDAYTEGSLTEEECLELIEKINKELESLGISADENGIYHLSTPRDMKIFSMMVNSGETSANAVLDADIDMSSVHNFTPIGLYGANASTKRAYRGVFDGNKHIVSNLRISLEEQYEVGLFSRVTSPGEVKNLGVVNATLNSAHKEGRVGAIAGYIVGINISNCWSAGKLEYTRPAGAQIVGGICGGSEFNSVTATNCWSTYDGGLMFGYPTYINCYPSAAIKAATGELCYMLNGDQSVIEWYQNVGEDPYPTWDSTRGVVVKNANGTYSTLPTGIEDIKDAENRNAKGVIYDLSGRRLSKATKGLYIVNGKKVLFK